MHCGRCGRDKYVIAQRKYYVTHSHPVRAKTDYANNVSSRMSNAYHTMKRLAHGLAATGREFSRVRECGNREQVGQHKYFLICVRHRIVCVTDNYPLYARRHKSREGVCAMCIVVEMLAALTTLTFQLRDYMCVYVC